MGNFETFIAKSTSTKKVLVEYDVGEERNGWYNYLAGIWAWKFYTYKYATHTLGNGNLGYGPLGSGDSSWSGETQIPLDIGSIRVDGVTYTEAATLAICISTDSRWYYDTGINTLYLHVANYEEPHIHTVIVGMKHGITNHAGYYNGLYYEPRLQSGVEINKSKDLLEYGIMSFDEASFTLTNNDGYYDTLFEKYIFGQPVVVLLGGDDLAYADYRTMFKGFISEAKVGEDSVEITAKDERKKLSRLLPINTFDQTTYPNLRPEFVGKPIPLVYGTVYNMTAICVDDNNAGTPYTFKVCDVTEHAAGIQAVDAVYVEGIAKTIDSTSVLGGTFNLTSANYTTGQNVTADIRGLSVMNSLSVITDILSCYTDIYYASATFDTVTWEAMSANAYTIGFVVNDRRPIYDIVEDIATSNGANFLIKDDGTFSWIKFSKTATVTATVHQYDILENERYEPTHNSEEFLTSCSIGYRKNWKERTFSWYTDTTQEDNGYGKYFRYKGKEIETYLTNATDAAALAAAIVDYMKDTRMKLTNTTGGVQFVDREIGEIINLNGDRPSKAWMGTVPCEIIEITKSLSDAPAVTIVGRELPR